MVGQARGDNCADQRVTHREGSQLGPEDVGGGIQAHIQCYKKEVEGCERQGERTCSPSEPVGKALACTVHTSTLFHCPFCHNTTLQYDRLSSVTRRSTYRISSLLFLIPDCLPHPLD